MAKIATSLKNSMAKSLSDTASIEFLEMDENFSFSATYLLSMGKLVPASAPLPRGSTSIRLIVSLNLSLSLLNFS